MSSKSAPGIEAVEAELLTAQEQEEKAGSHPAESPPEEEETYRRPHIGQVLKELRGAISLRELHRQTSIAVAHLSQIESGARTPGVRVLRRLAEFHAVEVTDLLERAGHIHAEQSEIEEDEMANVQRAYRYVLDDPRIRTVVKPAPSPPLDTQRFIVELYERLTNRNLL